MEGRVSHAEQSAERCEATLSASWPAAAGAEAVRAMFGGSIVRMRTAAEAARAPGAGPSATDTLHVVVRSTMEGNGIPTVVPVAPDGVAFQRGLVNGLITGIARQVMSELDADGVIMPGGPRLTSSVAYPLSIQKS